MAFEDREHIMNFMNVFLELDYIQHHFRPGGVSFDFTLNLLDDISNIYQCHFFIDFLDIEELLTENRYGRHD
jgi:NADH:ubiquinone oxidoreductase subunit D